MGMVAQIDIPLEKIAGFCRKWKVRELSLFGSVLREDFRDDSDVDILVEFEDDAHVGLFDFIDLMHFLEGILGCKVDMGTPDTIRGRLRERVLKEAIRVA